MNSYSAITFQKKYDVVTCYNQSKISDVLQKTSTKSILIK